MCSFCICWFIVYVPTRNICSVERRRCPFCLFPVLSKVSGSCRALIIEWLKPTLLIKKVPGSFPHTNTPNISLDKAFVLFSSLLGNPLCLRDFWLLIISNEQKLVPKKNLYLPTIQKHNFSLLKTGISMNVSYTSCMQTYNSSNSTGTNSHHNT